MTINLLDQPRTPEEIAEACEKTAEVLEGQWTQGDWYTPPYLDRVGDRHPAAFCIEGALAAVVGLEAIHMQRERREVEALRNCAVYRAVRDTIREQGEDEWIESLPGWNDAPGRTEQQVLDVLHATAKRVLGVGPDDA